MDMSRFDRIWAFPVFSARRRARFWNKIRREAHH
jgi:hypothetical protein